MHCYKLTIAYDGTQYSGWQIQPNAISIQQLIQEALQKLLKGHHVAVIGSGRTDAGVHAKAQIAHFRWSEKLDRSKLLVSLNGLLPRDIRIKKVEEEAPDFHAQYNATSKEYHYYLYLDQVMDPFKRNYCWHIHYRHVDISLLKEAAKFFVGTHDFTSFANEQHAGSVAKNPVRTIYRIDICEIEGGIRLKFAGNGFLYKMVRNIVGMLVEVASGRRPLEDISALFKAKDRRQAPMAAPPHGLFLFKVSYKEQGP